MEVVAFPIGWTKTQQHSMNTALFHKRITMAKRKMLNSYFSAIGSAASSAFHTSGRNCPSSSRGVVPILASTLVRYRCGSDAVAFATGDQRPQPSVVLGSRVVSGEQPIFSAQGDALERPLAGVVVDVEEAARHVGVSARSTGSGRR